MLTIDNLNGRPDSRSSVHARTTLRTTLWEIHLEIHLAFKAISIVSTGYSPKLLSTTRTSDQCRNHQDGSAPKLGRSLRDRPTSASSPRVYAKLPRKIRLEKTIIIVFVELVLERSRFPGITTWEMESSRCSLGIESRGALLLGLHELWPHLHGPVAASP